MTRKYSPKAQEYVEDAMHKMKRGKLESRGGRKVQSRKQAIAIGLSEAREHGARVPKKSRYSGSSRSKRSHRSSS
jgi:hypothetical protein